MGFLFYICTIIKTLIIMSVKRDVLKTRVEMLMVQSQKAMKENIERVLKSGCIDIESYDMANNPMVLPKAIWTAILEEEATQFSAPTDKQKKFKEEVKNIRYFL